jgi:hypothetical protein
MMQDWTDYLDSLKQTAHGSSPSPPNGSAGDIEKTMGT